MIGAASVKSEKTARMVAVCNTCSNNPDRVAGSLDIEDLDKLQLRVTIPRKRVLSVIWNGTAPPSSQ